MIKAVITPGITDLNRGDQALIWLIKYIFDETGIPIDVKLLQSGNNDDETCMQSRQSIDAGYDVMKPLLLHPARSREVIGISYGFADKLRLGLTAVSDLINTAMLLSKFSFVNRLGQRRLDSEQLRTYENFKKMDLLIVKGGGFLHTYKRLSDIYYLYFGLFNIMLARRLKKKVIIMPNSFGPFMGKLERLFVKKVLSKCDLIYARESVSKEYLQSLLGKEVYLSPDLGFYISSYAGETADKRRHLPESRKKVAVTMRPYRFPEYSDGQARYAKYLYEMFIVCKKLIDDGYHPVFVAHTLGPSAHEDDRIALNEVRERLTAAGVSDEYYTYIDDPEMNCFDITNLYSQVDYIIGTRFHSVIFAMTSLKPAIAISYSGNKSYGIMKDMGLEDYLVDIGEIDSQVLLDKFYRLVSETEAVKEKIKKYLAECEAYKEQLKLNLLKYCDHIQADGE